MTKLESVIDGIAWMLLLLVLSNIGVCNNLDDIHKSIKDLNTSVIELNKIIKEKEIK